MLIGLTTVNVELSSLCNKACEMCGRRKIDRDHPEIAMNYGDMDFSLIEKIADQLPLGIVIQFHWNGSSELHPRFGEAVALFNGQIKCIDTNGKLLVGKADEIIDNLDTLTVSVVENDPEGDEQYELVKEFLDIKGDRKPLMVYRLLGKVGDPDRWDDLPGMVCTRVLHDPMGSFKYRKNPTIPEIGICLDLLNHMAIDRFGKVSACVRFDPERLGVIGDANEESLSDIWNGRRRRKRVRFHLEGRRNITPLCRYCEYFGVPTGI